MTRKALASVSASASASASAQASPAAPVPARSTRNAGDTRARILAAARVRFSGESYENVGTRDIATDAGVDAALVSRYFGSKEKLFEVVIAGAFGVEQHLPASLDALGAHLARRIMEDTPADEAGFDPLRLLLRSAASPATAVLVAARFHAEFVKPLARLLRGRDAELRAALIASYMIGLATMKHALDSPGLGKSASRKAIAMAGKAIQECVGPEDGH